MPLLALVVAWVTAAASPLDRLELPARSTEAAERPAPVAPAEVPTRSAAPVRGAAQAQPVERIVELTGPPTVELRQRVTLQNVPGDAFVVAADVDVLGRVADNAFLMGQNVLIRGEILGDAYVVGQTLVVDAPVRGDLYVGGADVRITPAGRIDGNLVGGGAKFVHSGSVGGGASITSAELTLDGTINGDVSLEVGEVVLGSGARVRGDLNYVAPRRQSQLEPVVDGTVAFSMGSGRPIGAPRTTVDLLSVLQWKAFEIGWWYLGQLIIGVVLIVLGGELARGPGRVAADQPVMSGALGLVVAAVLMGGTFVATLSVVLLPLGVLGAATIGLTLLLGQIVAAMGLGGALLKVMWPRLAGSAYLGLAVGLVPLVLLGALPVVGNVVFGAAMVVSLGAFWVFLRSVARPQRVTAPTV